MRVIVAVMAAALAGCAVDSPRAEPPMAPPETSASPTREPRWDPRDVDDLPAAPDGVAPGLPATVEPPTSAPALAEQPVPAAVLSFQVDDAILLLAADGSWRSVPGPSEYGGANLTRDGTRLEVETESGIAVWDLPTGRSTHLPVPTGFRDWDYTTWAWLDHDTLLLDDGNPGGWRVDAQTGVAEQVPYPSGGIGEAIDPDGVVVESRDYPRDPQLTDWAGGERRDADLSHIGRLTPILATSDTVVGTAYQHGPFSVFVVDRADVRVLDTLTLRDHGANYSNGGLTPFAVLDDGTVLLRVAVFGKDFSWRLVAWDPASDDLSLVTHAVGTVTSYAADLLD